MCINVCVEGINGFLMQDNHVVFYESQNLKENKRNYVTCDLLLLVVVHALKMWQHYLMGKKLC